MPNVQVRGVTVLAAGGTIAMSEQTPGSGAVPVLDAADLVRSVPQLSEVIELSAGTLVSAPGVGLTAHDAAEIAHAAYAEARSGRGVVVTSGTDTLEELAVACDLRSDADAPIVLCGAIRPAGNPGADGPANLLDAVAAAGSKALTGFGAVICFAGELHAARYVRKDDSVSPRAFASPAAGPVGFVSEGKVTVRGRPDRRVAIPFERLDHTVEVVWAGLGSSGAVVRGVMSTRPHGLVAVVLGAGHTPVAFLDALEEAAQDVPVVAVVRPARGSMLRGTYGFDGSERDLRAGRIIPAGGLSAAAARIKLMACLGAGFGPAAIASAFEADDV